MCREEGGFIYNRKCFWVIIDVASLFTSAQAKEKCKEFDALPANIYDLQHFNQLLSYGREKRPGGSYIAHLGMKYDPTNNVLKNYDGSNAVLPDSVWSQTPAKRRFTEVMILIATDDEEGLGVLDISSRFRSFICETEQLSCFSLRINMETQIITCSEDSLTCTISCKRGFLDDGSTSFTLTCQDDLEWDGEVATCLPVECDELSFDGQPGLMHCTGNKYQNECNFVCASRKQLEGPRKRICKEDGTWSEMKPTCEGKNVKC
ncbi:uncharacterized protein LOC144425879 [Styela clava]